jgi:hypothetical protein
LIPLAPYILLSNVQTVVTGGLAAGAAFLIAKLIS